MPKNRKTLQPTPIEEIRDFIKKALILELFKMNVPQATIGKKLRMKVATVNDFLKGIKKDTK